MTDDPTEPRPIPHHEAQPSRTPPGRTPRGRRRPSPSPEPDADRRPGVRVALAARLLKHGRDPAEVAALTGVPQALLESTRHSRHTRSRPPRSSPATDGEHRGDAGGDRYAALVVGLRRGQRLRGAALGVAVGFGLTAGLAIAAIVSANVELARVSLLLTSLLAAAWLLVLLAFRRLRRGIAGPPRRWRPPAPAPRRPRGWSES